MATINGDNNDNTIYGTGGDDAIYGFGGSDTLYGYDGNDTLDGGTGNDTMYGGKGNDTYVVDSAGDVVDEAASAGTDSVNSYTNYTLTDNVEQLYLYGSATTGTGNNLNNRIEGNSNDNTLYGFDGIDTLLGYDGNDYLYGGTGNDTLNGGDGNDYLDGGTGVDKMIGGTGDDTYVIDSTSDIAYETYLTTGTDRVNAYASYTLGSYVENLYLYGTATNGTGNSLNNTIIGNSNDNYLDGKTGDDSMSGGTGNDTYVVDSASDVVYEAVSEGNDSVNAYLNYTLGANLENLYLYGTATTGTGNTLDNIIVGNSSSCFLYGQGGSDSLYGYGESDYLNGGAGNDYMSGGAGNDTYVVDSASDVVYEAASEGTDRVNSTINYNLGETVENLYLYGSATTGTGNFLDNTIVGNSNDNTLYGLDGNDILNGGTGDDTMAGGDGNDMYYVDSAGDVVSEAASAGTDRVNSYINYTLGANVEQLYLYGSATTGYGNALDNKLVGNSNADTLRGYAGNDSLYGYDGNDILNGGTGNDTMMGGAGDDMYYTDSASDIITEAASAGTDRVNSYINYTLGANVEQLYLYGSATTGYGNALDNKLVGNSNADTLRGYAGNDSLYGYDGNDILNGGTGNDTMMGGAGDDMYYIDSAGDVISEAASAGTDRVNAYINYTLGINVEQLFLYGSATTGYGNGLDNKIVGNSNADTLRGYAGNDSLYGYNSNDILNGDTGNDTMMGGAGDDMYYVDSAGDVIIETTDSGADRVNAYINYTLGANVENLYLYGTATTGTGNALDNKLVGNSNANTFRGYAGNDSLYGYDGNDILNGDTGNDTMRGGAGDDMYYVDSAGDVIIETTDSGADRVNSYIDYTLGSNVEQLFLYGSASTGTGNGLDNKIVGNSNADSLYGLAGNDSLNGGAGNDYLVGGAGNDTLNGGTGQDLFVFAESGSANSDTITSFSNTDDTIVLQDILDGTSDSAINGLSFTSNVLNAGSYFEGADYTGNGTENSGIYNNTTTGEIWYNPTSGVAGDSVLICTVGSTTAASLGSADFVYSA